MAVFVVLWPYLLTTKLSCLRKNNFVHTIQYGLVCNRGVTILRHGGQYGLIKDCGNLCLKWVFITMVLLMILNNFLDLDSRQKS